MKLDVVLSARVPDGQSEARIKEEIKIVSEWEILHVPVTAGMLIYCCIFLSAQFNLWRNA